MKEKIAFITGANKGIGFGIAKHLGMSDWKIIIGARNQERAEKAIRELTALGVEVSGWVNIELADLASVEQADDATMLQDFRPDPDKRYALVFGNEVKGVAQEVVDASDLCLEIPQYGTKHSLNVSVSIGIVLWNIILNNLK